MVLVDSGDSFKEMTLDQVKGIVNAGPILIDVQGLFPRKEA